MENRLLYTYALVKTFHEYKKDYIDSFYPFVLKVLPKNKSFLSIDAIQKEIENHYGLKVPEYTLKTIIKRVKARGYIEIDKWQLKLNDRGVKYVDRLESERNVDRRINELLEDVRKYISDNEQIELKQIYNIVLCFINKNIEPIVEFFDPSGICRLDIPQLKRRDHDEKLIQYFELVEKEKPELWNTLQDIIYGSVISTSIMAPKISEINKKFNVLQVFLDTNFIFSLFEFDFPVINKPAKELFELLKIYKFELKVFDFTVNEVVNVLGNYSREQFMYLPDVKVNSIYSNLKNKGWTNEDVREFIQKIEEKIWDLGIKIEPSNIDISVYKPQKEYMDKILKYKPLQQHQTDQVYCHDLAVIEKIKAIRKSPKREIEKSEAIFLTSDLRLSRFDFLELGHKEKYTICEVIPDRLLTNILWLKNPTLVKDIPLKSIIAIYSREVFIDRRIWRRFYENVRKLKEENRVEDKDISMLFYNRHIEEVLLKLDESEVDKITPEFILEEIQKMSTIVDVETQRRLKDQKRSFSEKIAQEIKKQKEWEEKLQKVKGNIKTKSEKLSNFVSNLMLFISVILIILGIEFLILRFSAILSVFVFPLFGFLGFLGIKFNIFNMRSKLNTKLFNLIYKRKLKELQL